MDRIGPTPIKTRSLCSWAQAGEERLEIGLNLKHNAKTLCVPDYTRAAPPDPNRPNSNGRTLWEYSDRAIALVKEYTAAFPWIAPGLERFGGGARSPEFCGETRVN